MRNCGCADNLPNFGGASQNNSIKVVGNLSWVVNRKLFPFSSLCIKDSRLKCSGWIFMWSYQNICRNPLAVQDSGLSTTMNCHNYFVKQNKVASIPTYVFLSSFWLVPKYHHR